MGLQLPSWLTEALEYVGVTWPEADETKLYEAGQAWLTFSQSSEEHAQAAIAAVDKMLKENSSHGLTAFDRYWEKVAGEGGYTANCRIVASAVAIALFAAAALVLLLKLLVIVQLIAFAIILAAAIAAAFFTLGASLAAAAEIAVSVNRTITTAVQTTILAIRELGPPLTELAEEHLTERIHRLEARPIHHSPEAVNSYKTPEQRERERREYERRKREIAYDHAHRRVTPGSEREAEVALGLEGTGTIEGPVENSDRPEADFKDGSGHEWDVKGFLTHPDPRRTYDRGRAESRIQDKLNRGINVALDTSQLSRHDFDDLKDLVASHPEWANRVVIY